MSLSTPYAARIRHVELLERNKAQTTDLSVYRDNALVIPTGATYTLIDSTGKKLVDGQSASIAGSGVVTYTHIASDIPSDASLGEGYVQEWSITIDAEIHVFRRMCSVVLRRLYPCVSDQDLTDVYSDIQDLRPSQLTSYQKYIDDAWFQILRKIRQQAQYEYLIMSSESFYEAHRHLALYLIFRDFHSSLGQSGGRYLDLANEHKAQYDVEYKDMNWILQASASETKPDDPNTRKSGQPVIFLSGRPHYRYKTRYPRY